MTEPTPGRATVWDWIRWVHAKARASEARRLAARPDADSPHGYARIQAARAKRAARNAKRRETLVLK